MFDFRPWRPWIGGEEEEEGRGGGGKSRPLSVPFLKLARLGKRRRREEEVEEEQAMVNRPRRPWAQPYVIQGADGRMKQPDAPPTDTIRVRIRPDVAAYLDQNHAPPPKIFDFDTRAATPTDPRHWLSAALPDTGAECDVMPLSLFNRAR